jgi:hypothetical protein
VSRKSRLWKVDPSAPSQTYTAAMLDRLPVGSVRSFVVGGVLRVTAAKTETGRWSVHSTTVDSCILADVPSRSCIRRAGANGGW